MFGALDSGKTCRSGNLTYNNGTIGFYCGSGTAISTGANTAMQNTEFSITVQGTPLDYTQTKLTLEYGDVIKTPSDGSNTQVSSIPDGLNIWLFQVNGASGAYAGKLYSFKMTGIKADNTEVVLRNYKPCLKSDGAIGLYDTVSGAFFTNDGTGSFTAGAEV